MATSHHTKTKGDLGVAKAHADLVSQGYVVLFPTTEHSAFDLVAYAEGRFHRVQVKYRSARAGVVTVHLRSIWADGNGTHSRPMNKAEVDVVCVYCSDTDSCHYFRPSDHGASVTIRFSAPRNGQAVGVLFADSCRTFAAPAG